MPRCAIVTAVAISLLAARASSASVTYADKPLLTQATLGNTALVLSTPILSQPEYIAKASLIYSTLFALEQSVTHSVSAQLYSRAVDKAIEALPQLIGPVLHEAGLSFIFATGSDSYLGCDFGYTLGVKDVTIHTDLSPEKSTLGFGFKPGNEVWGSFNLDINGTRASPYASVNLCGLWEPEAAPTLSAERVWGSISLTAELVDHQLVIKTATFNGALSGFHLDLGPISWFLELISLHDEFDAWLADIAVDLANEQLAKALPGALTAALRDKLNYGDSIQGLAYAIRPNSLVTGWNTLSVTADTVLAPITAVPCPGAPETCEEPTWPAVVGRPAEEDAEADAAAAVGISTMRQALYAAWRAGILQVDEEVDAAEVLGALLPGLPVTGKAFLKVYTETMPQVTFSDIDLTSTDPTVLVDNLVVNIKVAPNEQAAALDMTVRTSVSARAVLEITPPFLGEEPNPDGNRIQFSLDQFVIGETTATYGPGTAVLTEAERQLLMNELILPLYKSQVGILALSSSVIDFKMPNNNRRAALKLLRKERVNDALALYVKFDVSPAKDTVPPVARVLAVDGIVPDPATREVILGKTDAIVGYTASDDLERYNDYITFQTSLSQSAWTERGHVHALKLSELVEGSNWFYVRARDFADNLSADPSTPEGAEASARIVVDTLPPTTFITAPPPAFVNTPNVEIAFDGSDAGSGVADFMAAVDGMDFPFGTSHARSVSGLGEGPHAITIKARDRAGHVDPTGATAIVTVDLTAPLTAITGARTGYTKPSNARFTVLGTDNFSAPMALAFAAKLEGPACASAEFSEFAPAAEIDFSACGLIDGQYKLIVQARDEAGNIEAQPAQSDFIVDAQLPTVEIMETPPARSTSFGATFIVIGMDNVTPPEGLHYLYRVRGLYEEFSAPVTDPTIALDSLPSGDFVFEVTAVDLAGNESPVKSFAFGVDNNAPVTRLSQRLPEWLNSESVTLDVQAEDDRSDPAKLQYLVTIDNAEIRRMRAPLVLDDLAEGRHTINVAAVDEYGNADPLGVSMSFTLDRTAPETELANTPKRLTAGVFHPDLRGSDNLTPQDELRYSYRVIRGANTTEWSEPAFPNEVAIELRELGRVTLEIAAVDNVGLMDESPIQISSDVKAASGCACSSSETTPDEVASVLALSALVLFFRRRRS